MKQGYTDITIVLDRSGSMASVADDTIGGFNTFLHSQQAAPGEATLTLRQFDDQHEVVYSLPVKVAPKLDRHSFQPRGSTALLDAIGMAIKDTGQRLSALPEHERPEHVIVAIITDGLENASQRYSRAQIFGFITEQRDIYKWQFTFIGANQDAIAEAGALNIPAAAAIRYSGGAIGTRNVFHAMGQQVNSVRSGKSVRMSYEADQRAEAMEEDEQEQTPKP